MLLIILASFYKKINYNSLIFETVKFKMVLHYYYTLKLNNKH